MMGHLLYTKVTNGFQYLKLRKAIVHDTSLLCSCLKRVTLKKLILIAMQCALTGN